MEEKKILDAEMSRRSLLINAGKCAVGVAGITALVFGALLYLIARRVSYATPRL